MTEPLAEITPDVQFVVVTHYRPPEATVPIVHVWGPWPTRSKATTAKNRMQRNDHRDYPDKAGYVTFWVRRILP